MIDYPDHLMEDVHPEAYAADQIALRQQVCEAYFAPERVAQFAGLEPYMIMGGLLEAINETIAAEQARIVQLLVERVDVRMHGVEVRLRPNGLAGLVREVTGSRRAAA